jgi:hypothetical protein
VFLGSLADLALLVEVVGVEARGVGDVVCAAAAAASESRISVTTYTLYTSFIIFLRRKK